MRRVRYLSLIRLLAFASIIYFHIVIELYSRNVLTEKTVPFYYNLNFQLASTAVAMFFMISGAGLMVSSMKKEYFSIAKYYKSRVVRILIPYLIASAAVFALSMRFRLPLGVEPWKLVFNLFALDGYLGVLGIQTMYLTIGEWFMGCLVLIYIIYPILRYLVVKWPVRVFVILTAALAVYMAFYPFEHPIPQDFFFETYVFVLGMYLVRTAEKLNRGILLAAIPIILLYLFLPVYIPINDGWKLIVLCVSIYISFAQLEPLLSGLKKLNTAVEICCRYSYEVFLVHHLVIILLLDKLWIPMTKGGRPGVFAIVAVVVMAAFGVILHYVSRGISRIIFHSAPHEK